MAEDLVKKELLEEGITLLSLNRPDKRNALSIQLMQELCKAVEAVETPVLMLKGTGKVFCSGMDLDEIENEEAPDWVAKSLATLYRCPSITIACVQGAALAGGAGLMSACDFVVAGYDVQIGYPEIHRGLVAALVMGFLARQVRQRDVRELLLLGEIIDSARASEIGLVNTVVPGPQLMAEALQIGRKILKAGPEALKKTKGIIEELYPSNFEEELELALSIHRDVRSSQEAKEGTRAFKEKRSPEWQK